MGQVVRERAEIGAVEYQHGRPSIASFPEASDDVSTTPIHHAEWKYAITDHGGPSIALIPGSVDAGNVGLAVNQGIGIDTCVERPGGGAQVSNLQNRSGEYRHAGENLQLAEEEASVGHGGDAERREVAVVHVNDTLKE